MINALFGWPPPVLDPMGPYAEPVRTVAWALIAMATLVTLIVIAALWVAWKGPPKWRARLGGEKAVLGLGVAFPAVVLATLLIWGLAMTARLDRPPADGAMRVRDGNGGDRPRAARLAELACRAPRAASARRSGGLSIVRRQWLRRLPRHRLNPRHRAGRAKPHTRRLARNAGRRHPAQ